MLSDKKLTAFVQSLKPDQAKRFYKDILGLKLLSEDDYALEFDVKGTLLRVTTVLDLKPQPFTVLGWRVDNLVDEIRELNEKNILFERYDFLEQDKLGIWTSPNSTMVAWFKDPDGNILSLTE